MSAYLVDCGVENGCKFKAGHSGDCAPFAPGVAILSIGMLYPGINTPYDRAIAHLARTYGKVSEVAYSVAFETVLAAFPLAKATDVAHDVIRRRRALVAA